MTSTKQHINGRQEDWFAVRGPDVTFVQKIEVSPSLATVHRSLVYREDPEVGEEPENVAGQLPGVGYRLERWENVPAGPHWLQASSYALPDDADVSSFIAARAAPLEVSVYPLP